MSSHPRRMNAFVVRASALVNHSRHRKNSILTLYAEGYFSRIIRLRPDVLIGHLLREFPPCRCRSYYHIHTITIVSFHILLYVHSFESSVKSRFLD